MAGALARVLARVLAGSRAGVLAGALARVLAGGLAGGRSWGRGRAAAEREDGGLVRGARVLAGAQARALARALAGVGARVLAGVLAGEGGRGGARALALERARRAAVASQALSRVFLPWPVPVALAQLLLVCQGELVERVRRLTPGAGKGAWG